jgi:hypothetical protein
MQCGGVAHSNTALQARQRDWFEGVGGVETIKLWAKRRTHDAKDLGTDASPHRRPSGPDCHHGLRHHRNNQRSGNEAGQPAHDHVRILPAETHNTHTRTRVSSNTGYSSTRVLLAPKAQAFVPLQTQGPCTHTYMRHTRGMLLSLHHPSRVPPPSSHVGHHVSVTPPDQSPPAANTDVRVHHPTLHFINTHAHTTTSIRIIGAHRSTHAYELIIHAHLPGRSTTRAPRAR